VNVDCWFRIERTSGSGALWFKLFCLCEQISSITAQSRTVGLLSVPYQTLWEQAQLYVSVCNIITQSRDSEQFKGRTKHAWKVHSTLEYTYHPTLFCDVIYHIFVYSRPKLVLLSQSHNRAILYMKLVFIGKKKVKLSL
jgi:hypothetical protein